MVSVQVQIQRQTKVDIPAGGATQRAICLSSLLCSGSGAVFSGLDEVTHIGEGPLFTRPIKSNASVSQKHPHRRAQGTVEPGLWVLWPHHVGTELTVMLQQETLRLLRLLLLLLVIIPFADEE